MYINTQLLECTRKICRYLNIILFCVKNIVRKLSFRFIVTTDCN